MPTIEPEPNGKIRIDFTDDLPQPNGGLRSGQGGLVDAIHITEEQAEELRNLLNDHFGN